MCGTLCYAAPEVLDRRDYGVSSDMFSFSMVATEIIDGEYPLSLEQIPTNDFSTAIIKGTRPDVPKRAPASLQNLLKCCWQSNPHKRPTAVQVFNSLLKIQTEQESKATDLTEDLEEIMDDLPDKVITFINDMRKKQEQLDSELKQQREMTIKARAEAGTLRAELEVLRAAGAVIDSSSGLAEINN
mmetsp:Transcript_21823/g.30579  ORF Transcript_21823/g.30579 Transcript_21823/m.30579 type:complete len:186 (+) Transcript_21823:76-633(+)